MRSTLLSLLLATLTPSLAQLDPSDSQSQCGSEEQTAELASCSLPGNQLSHKLTQNGTAVVIPPNYWLTVSGTGENATKEVSQFLNEDLPNPESSPDLNFFHEYLDNFNLWTDGVSKQVGLPVFIHVRPTLNTLFGLEIWASLPFDDISTNNCLCTQRDKEARQVGNTSEWKVSEQGPWTWRCSPIERTWFSPLIPIEQTRITQVTYNIGAAQRVMFFGVSGLLKHEESVERMARIQVSNPLAKQDEVLMRVAGLPANASSTMLGAVKKLQYALYQQMVTNRQNCPMPEVACGKHAEDTCEDEKKIPGDTYYTLADRLDRPLPKGFEWIRGK